MRAIEEASLEKSPTLRALQEELRQHPVQVGLLFGSRATGDTHSRSDIDIAIAFDSVHPGDPEYNEVFFGLSADLCEALDTDDIDLVDLRTAPPELTAAVFDRGVLLVGDPEHATALQNELTSTDDADPSPRERFDNAIARIDEHLSGSAVTATDGENHDR